MVTTIKDIKKGDFFRLKDSESATVWVRDEYDKSSKKYWVYKFDDVNHGKEVKGTQKVFTEFTF